MWIFNEINLQNVKGDAFGVVTAAVITSLMALGVITVAVAETCQTQVEA